MRNSDDNYDTYNTAIHGVYEMIWDVFYQQFFTQVALL